MRRMIRWSLTSALLLSVGVWSAGALPEGASYGGDAHVFVFTPEARMAEYHQAPELAEMEAQGLIPSLADRLPDLPPIVVPHKEIGKYGGTIRLLETRYTNFRDGVWYFKEYPVLLTAPNPASDYANLVESHVIADDSQSVTFKLRKGLKWSDGAELTTEDFRFAYYDILLYAEDADAPLSEVAPGALIIGGEVAEMDIIGPHELAIRWNAPLAEMYGNVLDGYFLEPQPAHYLKQFHPRYAEQSDQDASEMFQAVNNMIQGAISNPEFPTLAPWIADEVSLGEHMVMRRNPYYWKVDPAGNQLPYIDKVRITYIKSPEVALLNATAGAIDFEHGRVSYVGGPILYQSQQSGDYSLVGAFPKPLFSVVQIQQAWIARALRGELPDQRPDDGKLAELLRNPQFVEALVHSIDTEQLTRAYVGADLAEVMGEQFPQIPYLSMNGGVGTYTDHPEVQELWDWLSDYQTFDLARSNALLDELGLTVGSDGFRQYPDGGRIELPIGIWDGNQKNFELTTIQGEVFERELKLKTFVQMGSRAAHLQTWLFNSEMPILGSSARVYDWVGSVSSPLSSLNHIHGGYPIINWLRSDGAQGVEPFPEQIPVLKRLQELGTESGQTMDMGRRLELGIEAAQLVTRNHTTGVIVLAGQQALPWYLHNRIKNYVGGATKDQSEVHIETWYIDE